jgi:hypothetical protein
MNDDRYRLWIALATQEQRQQLAEMTGMSYPYLVYQIGKKYMLPPSVSAAVAIEEAIAEINGDCPGLPDVTRDDIAPTCRECPFARKARGDA